MIQANELRVGNWLLYDDDGNWTPQRVVYIGTDTEGYEGYFVGFGWASCTIEDHFKDGDIPVKPIPLTPEILEKCGFKPIGNFNVANTRKINLGKGRVLSVSSIGTPNEMVFLSEEKPPEIKQLIILRNYDYDGKTYLHHIQNIFHSLTGQELTVNL